MGNDDNAPIFPSRVQQTVARKHVAGIISRGQPLSRPPVPIANSSAKPSVFATKSSGSRANPSLPVRPQGPQLRTKGASNAPGVDRQGLAEREVAGSSRQGRIPTAPWGVHGPRGSSSSSALPLSNNMTSRMVPSIKTSTPRQISQNGALRRLSMITASPPSRGPSKQTAKFHRPWYDNEPPSGIQSGDTFETEGGPRRPELVRRMGFASGSKTRARIVKNKKSEGQPVTVIRNLADPDGRETNRQYNSDGQSGKAREPAVLLQFGLKAARKIEHPPPLFYSSDEDSYPEDSEVDQPEESNVSSSSSSGEEDELLGTDAPSNSHPALETPHQPLREPSSVGVESQDTSSTSKVPPDELIKAVKGLTLPCVRMQITKSLPFLLRNLRNGFRYRCRTLGIPTECQEREISVIVRYEHSVDTKQVSFETPVDKWLCPLCELHGPFPNREMLAKHLEWDHTEVRFDWLHKSNDTWKLTTVLLPGERRARHQSVADGRLSSSTGRHSTKTEDEPDTSLFPFVSLSPSREDAGTPSTRSQSPLPPRIKYNEEPPTPERFGSLSSRRKSGTMPSSTASFRERSTTAATTTTTTDTTRRSVTIGLAPLRYPTPPPASNRLGPAAQPPYLPFKSEYGGPDIYYSCRPGGATVFDLLDTLPLEPFGVLSWDVLDREDEIFDSDDIQVEHKVMHALWGRWIVLNRNKFIADYQRGAINFVDTYWIMIHRAAGWSALRYFLLILLANRFLTGADVVQILKHYENLVGMEHWD